ncbi:trypsin delta-like [Anopheles aquasalis]|uniref:trypsin delta-like n=1 Tax=Anopheles aquasalis TaxID=42839 RepID=UPI00215B63F3|nr:trypsin delta-like [Anopheles aquasalis]
MKQVLGILAVVAVLCAFTRSSYAFESRDTSDEERGIIGGRNAPIISYPFALMLLVDGSAICTASVIGEFYALTAAHCLVQDTVTFQNSQISFFGGSSIRGSEGTIFNASYYVIHGEYNTTTIDNDVAVVRVTTSFFTNPAIKPIALQDGEPAASSSCYAVGWGFLTIPPNFIKTQTLQVASYTLETAQNCENLYGATITAQMYCARYESGRVYKGDSGGALVCGDRLHGIASFVPYIDTYGIHDKPEVFTKVPSHSIRRFIRLHTGI